MSFLFSIIAFRKVRAEINFFPLLSEGITEQTNNIYDAVLVTLKLNKYIVYNLLLGFESAVSRREQRHVATPRHRRCQQGARVGIFARETWLSSWPGSVY